MQRSQDNSTQRITGEDRISVLMGQAGKPNFASGVGRQPRVVKWWKLQPRLTVHKTQALSIRHIVRGCLEGIFAVGQLYVLVSRVTDPRNFQLCGLPPADLLFEIFVALTKEGLDAIECFRRCVTVTNEWVYSPVSDELRNRFAPRFVHERMVPTVHRELHEMLNPMPRAAAVMHRLLEWIDRCDLASQRDEPKPTFATITGKSIFPDDEEPWWLTDVQRKTTTEAQHPGDEDGPHVEEGDLVDEVDQETDDEDPPSDASVGPAQDNAAQGMDRPPRMAWKHNCYAGHFERQRGAHCGMHALNNAVGRQWQTEEDMYLAIDDYLATCWSEGLPEVRAEHATPSGWYSIEVMSHAVTSTSMRNAGRVEFVLELQPLHVNVGALRSAVGAIVNIQNRHWVAIRRVANQLWYLDSQEPQPLPMTEADLKTFVFRHRAAFAIVRAEDMGAPGPRRCASAPGNERNGAQTLAEQPETLRSLSRPASSACSSPGHLAEKHSAGNAVVLSLLRQADEASSTPTNLAQHSPVDQAATQIPRARAGGTQLMEVDSAVPAPRMAQQQHGPEEAT